LWPETESPVISEVMLGSVQEEADSAESNTTERAASASMLGESRACSRSSQVIGAQRVDREDQQVGARRLGGAACMRQEEPSRQDR